MTDDAAPAVTAAETEAPTADIRILGGEPTPVEIAAVTAVVSHALDEIAGEHRRRGKGGMTAWAKSQRGVRQPLPRGSWRAFRG